MKNIKNYWYKRNTKCYIENIIHQSISEFVYNLYLEPKITLIRFHSLYHSLSLAITHRHSLSFVVLLNVTRWHSL